MKRIALALFIFSFALGARGQTFGDYLKLRKRYGITQSTGIAALETLVGTRVLEVKGVVKGVIRMGNEATLMVQASDGSDVHVDGTNIPEWLMGNEIPARLIVKAERHDEFSPVRAGLLGAASELQVAALEARVARQQATANRQPTRQGKPRPLPGRILSNPISWNLPGSDALPYYSAFVKGRNPRLSSYQASRIAQGVIGFSIRYGVDARLIMAMILVESNFNPSSRSKSGAMGLGQLMPGTARGMGVSDAYDSIENLYGTVRLVRGHLEKYRNQTGDAFDSLVLTLAAYNAGSGAVKRHGGVPPYSETQAYVRRVIAIYRKLVG